MIHSASIRPRSRVFRQCAAALACTLLAGAAVAQTPTRLYASINAWVASDPAKVLEVSIGINGSQPAGGKATGSCALGGMSATALFTSQGVLTGIDNVVVTPTVGGETVSASIRCTLAFYALNKNIRTAADFAKVPPVISHVHSQSGVELQGRPDLRAAGHDLQQRSVHECQDRRPEWSGSLFGPERDRDQRRRHDASLLRPGSPPACRLSATR